jgi:hypothetical protein
VKIIDKKIYIEKNCSNNSAIIIGSEITSINGIGADSILRIMQPQAYGWTDGFTKSNTRIELYFDIFLLDLFNHPDKYVLNTTDPNGNSIILEIEALDYNTIDKKYPINYGYNPRINKEPFRFREIDSLSTAVIKIDGFFEGLGYENFLANSFEALKKKGIKNLIIDLRGNFGGNGYYPNLLYSYIAVKEYKYQIRLETTIDNPKDTIFKYGNLEGDVRKYKPKETRPGMYDLTKLPDNVVSKKPYQPNKNNFTGNVFVLTDVKTYSASAEFCAITHYNRRAKFIGRETGGAYCGNTSGFDFLLTLPKTQLRVSIPLIRSYLAVEIPCEGGIKPDYPLKEDINDYILNKDSDLLFTLDLINRSK